jgi:hemolysin III
MFCWYLVIMHLPTTSSGYPLYDRSERIADGLVHLIGVVLGMVGTVLLIVFSALWANSASAVVAVSVYTGLMLFGLIASAVYHFTPWEGARPVFRRIDHAAIYLKIAGTYTPIVVLIGSAFAYGILAFVWALAVFGAIRKLLYWSVPGSGGSWLYLGLGWVSLLLLWPVAVTLPLAASVLIVAGGLLYTAGVIFFTWEKLRYSIAIWHGFVLAASGCFFAAISVGVFSATV